MIISDTIQPICGTKHWILWYTTLKISLGAFACHEWSDKPCLVCLALLLTFNVSAKGHPELIPVFVRNNLLVSHGSSSLPRSWCRTFPWCGCSPPVRSSGDPTMHHVIMEYTVDWESWRRQLGEWDRTNFIGPLRHGNRVGQLHETITGSGGNAVQMSGVQKYVRLCIVTLPKTVKGIAW